MFKVLLLLIAGAALGRLIPYLIREYRERREGDEYRKKKGS